jgi:hypothetical protein
MSDKKDDLLNAANHLEMLAHDEKERDKVLAAARDNFIGKRITQASRLEQLREKLITKVEQDIDDGKLNQSMKIRYLEVLSNINEADLSAFMTNGKSGSGVTIFNSNSNAISSSDLEEKVKSIKIISSEGKEIISNESEAHLLKEAIEAVKTGFISMNEIKNHKELIVNDSSENGN